jgi:hypothetical protein
MLPAISILIAITKYGSAYRKVIFATVNVAAKTAYMKRAINITLSLTKKTNYSLELKRYELKKKGVSDKF